MPTFGNGRRVAIVAGLRTPFERSGTLFKSLSAQDLGRAVVAELVARTELDGKEIDTLVFGTVVPSVLAPNIAREVALLPMLPKGIPAVTVSRACTSANQAITDAADQIALGHADVAIAGGAESLSNVPILHSRGFANALVAASKAKTIPARFGALARIRPRDLIPITPAIAEPSTGETMGQSAEKMAKLNHIPRDEQDQFALRSHRLAAAGTQDGTADGGDHAVLRAAEVRRGGFERQRHSPGLDARAARGAQARIRSQVRHGDGGKFVAAHRWCRCGPAHERRQREGASATLRSRTSSRTHTRRSIRGSSCCRRRCSQRRLR